MSIHQPNYLPWLGFFHKMSQCDVFVILDNVQFSKHMFQNRTKIKTAQGENWLTVPVITKNFFGQLINQVVIDNKVNWQKKHLGTLETNYSSSPYFQEYFDWFKDIYSKNWQKLCDLNITIIEHIASGFGTKVKLKRASSLSVTGKRSELLLNICKCLNADTYLAGPSSKKYLDKQLFANQGVDILYHNFRHPIYKQQFGKFIPKLSILDLLFNHGKDSFEILTNSNNSTKAYQV